MRKSMKLKIAALVAGTVCLPFIGGGCLGKLFQAAVANTAVEYLLDNDGVFDLFEDGAAAAAPAA